MSYERSYRRSVDFNRNIVPLRCPFGVWSHFQTRSNQVDTKLALKAQNISEKLFISKHKERNL